MRATKRIIAILLSVLMAVTTMAICAVPASAEYKVGDTIQFGTYPQTKVSETTALKNAADKATWASYDYYFGYGELDERVTVGKYVQFADFFANGEKYRAVKFPRYRVTYTYQAPGAANSFQDDNGYTTDVTYYFKYEPLTWRVLDPSAAFIMCEDVIDSQAYQNTILKIGEEYYKTGSSTVYANNYKESSIRTWLNDHFYNTAFTKVQQAIIKSTTIDNSAYTGYAKYDSASTSDKIFLLSNSDARNSDYGFSSSNRKAKGTDYAECQGLEKSSKGSCTWIMRTAGVSSQYVSAFGTYFSLGEADVNKTSYGIRPACKVVSLTSPGLTHDVNPGLYSAGNKVVEVHVGTNDSQAGDVTTDAEDRGRKYGVGDYATVTATANPGWKFVGWKKSNATVSTSLTYSFKVEDETYLRADFEKITYSITVAANPAEGGTVTGGGTYAYDKSVTVTATPKAGYAFDCWYGTYKKNNGEIVSEQMSTNASYTFNATKDIQLKAQFKKLANPATVDIRNFTANKTLDYRTTITFTAVVENPVNGAAVHWFVNGSDAGTGETYTVKEAKKDFTVQAKYVKGSDTLAESGVETVKVNSGFFARLKAFFRGLFGRLPVIAQEFLGAEFIDLMLSE